jgi:CRP/FNR family transcriptional regulator, cyclic AMP receptor protein
LRFAVAKEQKADMEGTDLSGARPEAAFRRDRGLPDRERWLRWRLSWLPEDRLRELASVGRIERVRARSIINVSRDMVRFVVRGAVRLQYAASANNATVISISGPGDLLSKLFFKEAPRVKVQAITDCALLNLPRKPFLDAVMGKSGDELDQAVNLIFGGALALLSRYWQTLGVRLMVRLAAVLVELAQKFGVADSRGTLIDLKLSQKDLARMIGCSRQQLHALMESLAQRRIVMRQGRQLILNVDEVKRLARTG